MPSQSSATEYDIFICLSPNYFDSHYCRWKFEEYVRRQIYQLIGSDCIATVYFIEAPGSDEQAVAAWREEILRANYTDLRPWFPEGAGALQLEDVRRRSW